MEDKVNRIIEELEYSISNIYPGEEIERDAKAAIELLKELESIRQFQILSLKAAHESLHKIRKVIEEL